MAATETESRAVENALAHAESILAAYEACAVVRGDLDGCDSSREARALLREHDYRGDNGDEVAEAIENSLREEPLSLTCRSGWQLAGEPLEPEEYCLLLSTGGPALRLIGAIGNGCADSATLEHQDWFTRWEESPTTSEQDQALLWFANLFYFGD